MEGKKLKFYHKIWKPDYSEEITLKSYQLVFMFIIVTYSVDKVKQHATDVMDYNPKVTSFSP